MGTQHPTSPGAYQPPKRPPHVDLRLDCNEGVPPLLDTGVLETCLRTDCVRRYPDASALQARLAEKFGLDPRCVFVTAGGDEALDLLMRATLKPGDECLMHAPSFEMLNRYVRLAGATAVHVPWWEGPFPTGEMIRRITPRTAIVTVVSPNNPTGGAATADDLRRLAAAAPDAILLADLAYAEFADEDLSAATLALPNGVAMRTLSKAWGLAGLRVGYALGPPRIIDAMRAAGHPYSVSGLSLAVAAHWYANGEEQVRTYLAQVRTERQRLFDLLRELGANPVESQANFVFCRFADAGRPTQSRATAGWVFDALTSLGIAVRIFSSDGELKGCLRITCPGGEADMRRLDAAVRASLRPQALLFDLDGVLADVSASYRQAVRQTAESYGVQVTPEDIAAAKRRGGANNDWELTHRLIAERGVQRPLAEITERFERLYQGHGDQTGFKYTERLLLDADSLGRLARRLPLALVTGRPRADAVEFLERFGVAGCFKTIVAMHDAPAKPDPAPVRLALERLGVQSAWLIGDTVDDVRSARAAGVVPLGVCTTENDPRAAADALRQAGAARVLEDLAHLESMLP